MFSVEEAFSLDELEDIRKATELSLQEYSNKGKGVADDDDVDLLDDEDLELSRAVEESLQISSQSRFRFGGPKPKPSFRNAFSGGNHKVQIICDVCDAAVSRKAYGVKEYWNQKFCLNHLRDGTLMCCSCKRLETSTTRGQYIDLGDRDGRSICRECCSTAILTTSQMKRLATKVLQFLNQLGIEITAYVPVFMVDSAEMNGHASGGTSQGPPHPGCVVYGLTMSGYGYGAITATSIARASRFGNRIRVEKERHRLTHSSGITIMVLYGMPMIIASAILAHEYMHAWLRLKGLGGLKPKIEEGICQVISYEWLNWMEREMLPSSSTSEEAQFERNLKATHKHEVELNSSDEYGEGFRDAQHAVSKYGLAPIVNHIIKYRSLPKATRG